MPNQEFSYLDLYELIKEVMGIKAVTNTIQRQILRYTQEGMTPKEIGRCIVYYDEVLHAKFEPIYGIAFVSSVKDRAAEYFKKLELDQQQQAEEAKKIVEYQENNIIFNIKSLKHKHRKPKQLDISTINIEGDKDNDR